MRYELIKQSIGSPTNSLIIDKEGKETPTGKMFVGITLTVRDNETKNKNSVWEENLTVEFEKTLSVDEIEKLIEQEVTNKVKEINA